MINESYNTIETKKDENFLVISNILITDEDILYMLKNKISITKNIMFSNCYVEFKKISNKNILEFINNYKLKECKVYISKQIHINKDIRLNIQKENNIYESDFLSLFLSNHNNSLKTMEDKIIEGLVLKDVNLSSVDLGSNSNFFQLIKNQKVENVILPPIDFNKFNIDNVEFLDCKFTGDTIFPNDFFQQIKQKKLVGCSLPPTDFSKTNMNDVSLMFTNFANESTFPVDINFFKQFNILSSCKLPIYDYTNYDFNGANIQYCSFKEKSILPMAYHLDDTNINNNYPKSFAKLLHIIPLKNLKYEDVIFKYGKYLTEQQKLLIYLKLNDN